MSRELALRLPDLPRWVEVRSLLSSGHCEIYGFTDGSEPSLIVRDPDGGDIFVIGSPTKAALDTAVEQNVDDGLVIAPAEQTAELAQFLRGWTATPATLHTLSDPHRLPTRAPGAVRFLDPMLIGRLSLPAELTDELESGARNSAIAAAFVDEQPVAFCYAGATTESYWDIAIDTLPEYRRRGFAARCVTHMIQYMGVQGKQPIWGSAHDNPPSWQLARKLGFVAVDELVLFERRSATTAE